MKKIQRRYWALIAIFFFLLTVSMATFGLRPVANNSNFRISMGFGPSTLESHLYRDSSALTQESTLVPLIRFATVYTNLTETVFMVAESNNSLLNCKGFLWIQAHHNLSSTSIGPLVAGTLTATTLSDVGSWFNFTTGEYFFSIKLRKISNAQEITEIAQDIEEYNAEIALTTAYIWTVQSVFGAIVATAFFGRMKMRTVSK